VARARYMILKKLQKLILAIILYSVEGNIEKENDI
jgi:hypothetical protein